MSTKEELEKTLAERGWDRGVTVKHNPDLDGEYLPKGQDRRALYNGHPGIIIDMSNAHGLCFCVQFPDLGSAWYEPEELEQV